MIRRLLINLVILSLTLNTSYAGNPTLMLNVKPSSQQLLSRPNQTQCNIQFARTRGYCDATMQRKFNFNFGYCGSNIVGLNNAYNEGYNNAKQGILPAKDCIKSRNGQESCGYNCITTLTNSICAMNPCQDCVQNNSGKTACGYSCVTSLSDAKCTLNPLYNCINLLGHLVCGKNCQIKNGSIVCDEYEK